MHWCNPFGRLSTPNNPTCALTFAHQIGKKRLQLVGFAAMGAIFFVMACAQPSLRQGGGSSWLLLLYSLSFFFSDFGPNTTTFIIPALIFPTEGTARAGPLITHKSLQQELTWKCLSGSCVCRSVLLSSAFQHGPPATGCRRRPASWVPSWVRPSSCASSTRAAHTTTATR